MSNRAPKGTRKVQKQRNRPPRRNNNVKINSAPVSKGVMVKSSKPRMQSEGNGFVIRHREFIQDVTGSVSPFEVVDTLALQPGDPRSFPWLSCIASRYESYDFLELSFELLPEVSTSEPGYISLVPEYDATDSAPISKSSALNNQSAISTSVFNRSRLICHNNDLHKRKTYFVRVGSVTDKNLTDVGNLFIIAGNNSDAGVKMQLWVSYRIRFRTPQIMVGPSLGPSAKINAGGTITPAAPFGTSHSITYGREEFLSVGSNTITLTRSVNCFVYFYVQGTGITSVTITSSGTANTLNSLIATTSGADVIIIQGQEGDVLTVAVSATTLTACSCRLGNYAYSVA
jgi:hypothetical protein